MRRPTDTHLRPPKYGAQEVGNRRVTRHTERMEIRQNHRSTSVSLGPTGWIGQVPVFVAATTGSSHAFGMCFRVGEADETPEIHGLSHLIEHLTLTKWNDSSSTFNGLVDVLTTNFTCSGTKVSCAAFAAAVTAALLAPDYSRIDRELGVLRAEAARKAGPTLLSLALAQRCGPTGFGVRSQPESVVDGVSESMVASWIASNFTASNAAIWTTLSPEDLDLAHLPSGQRLVAPEPVWLGHHYPAVAHVDAHRMAVNLVVRDAPLMRLALDLLRDRLFDRLRFRDGLCYDVQIERELLGGSGLLNAVVSADVVDGTYAEVRNGFLAEFHRFVWDGPSDQEVQRRIDAWTSRAPESEIVVAARLARDELLGVVRRQGDVDTESRIPTPDELGQLGATCAAMDATTLWMIPQGAEWADRRAEPVRPPTKSRFGMLGR